jgi:hypothetical protein
MLKEFKTRTQTKIDKSSYSSQGIQRTFQCDPSYFAQSRPLHLVIVSYNNGVFLVPSKNRNFDGIWV